MGSIAARRSRSAGALDRRRFLKVAAAGAAGAAGSAAAALGTRGFVAPAVAQRAAAGTVRLIPHAGLASLDPVWSTSHATRNAAALVWDTLYGIDAGLMPRRQMVESEELSGDNVTWTFRLRPGLKFHNGEPVRAADAVASINRWAARDRSGRMIKDREEELAALDDRTFRWVLKRPFPRMLTVLGKAGPPCCFVMPEAIAATDAYQQIGDYVGSGPMRFLAGEWVPGARAAFERFAGYAPRPEPASWLAGGKRMLVDRVEWNAVGDPADAVAALESGTADWWELVPAAAVPRLRSGTTMTVAVRDPLGDVGLLCMNQLVPPFNAVEARRALLAALSQPDYMRAAAGAGGGDGLWQPMPGFFTPGTPLANDDGGDILKGARRLDEARRLLAEGGYDGQPVACLEARDQPVLRAWGQLTEDMLHRLGMTVERITIDRAGMAARREQGGWNLCPAVVPGADCIDPTNELLRASGEVAANGWADVPDAEGEVYDWFDARTAGDGMAAARRFNKVALDNAICAPLGFFLSQHAWRKELAGIVAAPLPLFWGVGKGA